MKKISSTIIFSAFLSFQFCTLLFAQANDKSDINAVPDKFGNAIYFYTDGDKDKQAISKAKLMDDGSSMADSSGTPNLKNTVDEISSNEKPTILALLDEEDEDFDEDDEYLDEDDSYEGIYDPLEPVNRVFFHINDKLYFWLLKPAATGYRAVVPQPARISVGNFFYNLAFPIRFVNCLLQVKFESAGNELGRFLVNTTLGVGGLFDPATSQVGLTTQAEDLGQTLGTYGMGPGLFINWPILGPSSLRDTFGLIGDSFVDPMSHNGLKAKYKYSARGLNIVNKTSFRVGDYEDLKKTALDPYTAIKDIYFQYRESQIKK